MQIAAYLLFAAGIVLASFGAQKVLPWLLHVGNGLLAGSFALLGLLELTRAELTHGKRGEQRRTGPRKPSVVLSVILLALAAVLVFFAIFPGPTLGLFRAIGSVLEWLV